MADSNAPTRRAYPAVHAFLEQAGARPEFAFRVTARVDAKSEDWDHSYEWASLSALIGDAMRQAVDVAGYSAILAARLEHDGGDQSAARRARALLTAVTERSGQIDVLLGELRRLVERAA